MAGTGAFMHRGKIIRVTDPDFHIRLIALHGTSMESDTLETMGELL